MCIRECSAEDDALSPRRRIDRSMRTISRLCCDHHISTNVFRRLRRIGGSVGGRVGGRVGSRVRSHAAIKLGEFTQPFRCMHRVTHRNELAGNDPRISRCDLCCFLSRRRANDKDPAPCSVGWRIKWPSDEELALRRKRVDIRHVSSEHRLSRFRRALARVRPRDEIDECEVGRRIRNRVRCRLR